MRNALLQYPISTVTGQSVPTFEEKAAASNALLRFLFGVGEFGKTQANRFVMEPLNAMSRIGAALRGDAPSDLTYDQFAEDARNALLTYNMPGMAFSKTSPNVLGVFAGRGAKNAPRNGKLNSLFPEEKDILPLSEAYKIAKGRGIVESPEEFRKLLTEEARAGLIDGGRGSSSRSLKDSILGNPDVNITGYIKKIKNAPKTGWFKGKDE